MKIDLVTTYPIFSTEEHQISCQQGVRAHPSAIFIIASIHQ